MKLKTNKALAKRLKITKKRKILIRPSGQDHFKAKDSGKLTKRKRTLKEPDKSLIKTMRAGRKLPYSF